MVTLINSCLKNEDYSHLFPIQTYDEIGNKNFFQEEVMFDYLKRFLIALAIALCIGVLFMGATVSFSASNEGQVLKKYIWPTEGIVSDTFGTRKGTHFGIDIAAQRGTPVVSVADGVVTKSYYSNTYGHVVFIEHTDGYETVYAHLHKRMVNANDVVYQGEQIGIVGNTGQSRGNHLHFEVHDSNWTVSKKNAVDPFDVLKDPSSFFVLDESIIRNKEYLVAAMNTSDEETRIINVQKGDTLEQLARQYNVTVSDIKSWNHLKTDLIRVGQGLTIRNYINETYEVKQGDTLLKIAQETGVPVEKIKEINGLQTDVITIGSTLKLTN